METNKIKTDLQKTIKSIRDELNAAKGETERTRSMAAAIPKAMMTDRQMEKRTATVNCGAGWLSTGKDSKSLAQTVSDSAAFKEFLDRAGATARIEPTGYGYQIRITY